ncbi:MAG: T9SS type A sorting domain-containing protein [Candidatus Neomarinimicrobiota bacterium]
MKNILKTLAFLALSMTVLLADMVSSELLFIPWGDEEKDLKHASYPGLHNGPLSFQVNGDEIYILDSENKMIKLYDHDFYKASIEIEDPHVLDFYKDSDKLYLMKQHEVYLLEKGKKEKLSELDDVKKMYYGFKNEAGNIVVNSADAKISISQNILSKAKTDDLIVRRELPSSLKVKIAGSEYSYDLGDIGSVDLIGSTDNAEHYIYAESIIQHSPLKVQRYVLLIDNEGELLQTLELPRQKFTYVFKEFTLGDEGELYHMHSAKDGIHIIRWDYVEGKEKLSTYPSEFSEEYYFNDFVETEPQMSLAPTLNKKAASSVSRTQTLITADEYVQHIWTATAANIGTTSTVTTPEWIKVGQNQRVPYKWGGWNTVAEFDVGIAAGKLAGDRNTSVVDYGNSVGADCSGFACVCWETTSRYTTRTFNQVTTELGSFNDLLPADATNNAGSHIRMVVEWTDQGKLVQIEETGSGWAARYYTWNISDLSAYKPVRYNSIQNTDAPMPHLVAVQSENDSVQISWEASETVDFIGYKIFRKSKEETDFSAIAEVPKGTMEIRLAQPKNVQYDYYVGSYDLIGSEVYNVSDTYSCKNTDSDFKVLIVDGFDRMASYSLATHRFSAQTADAMDYWNVAYDASSNDAVIYSQVSIEDYDMLWWILGDESTADQTFNATEQTLVKAYLKQGGKLFVSGSEIGWDLDQKGTTNDKDFFHNYLKAAYVADNAESYTVSGVDGTNFEHLSFRFSKDGAESDTYPEDYPDVLTTSGGSKSVLKYANNKTAAVAYSGAFPSGTKDGKVMVMGFPFEVIITKLQRELLAGEILLYMGYDSGVAVEESLPESFVLRQNYPNPFNPTTTIEYSLNNSADIAILVYNIKGDLVRKFDMGYQSRGLHKMIFDGTNLSSGLYVYRLDINNEPVDAGKMVLSK